MPGAEPPGLIAILGRADGGTLGLLVDRIRAQEPGLASVVAHPGVVVMSPGADPRWDVRTNRAGTVVVIGTLFDRAGRKADLAGDMDALDPDDIRANAARLVARYWGAYTAFFVDRKTRRSALLRDSSGAIAVTTRRFRDLLVVASRWPDWLSAMFGGRPAVDWPKLAHFLIDPPAAATVSALVPLDIPLPGTLCWADAAAAREPLWDPVSHARKASGSGAGDGRDLEQVIVSSVAALARGYPRVALELSGGLDSSIVLGALTAVSPQGARLCINVVAASAGGDERRYARIAATAAGAPLVEAAVAPEAFDFRRLLERPREAQPVLYGVDLEHDRLVSQAAERFDARAIFTGQGGDAVFFQMKSPLVFADRLADRGLASGLIEQLFASAQRAHMSIWGVLHAAWRAHRARYRPFAEMQEPHFLGEEARAELARQRLYHPWLLAAHALPPAKRLQLEAIVDAHMFHGPTSRGRARPLLHPLLAQPVVEACLAIPVWKLAGTAGDRPLARARLARLVPPEILARHAKGEASSHYSRAVVANLDFLRALLLEGRLVEHGLVDRATLDAALDEDRLLWSSEYRSIFTCMALESWARQWD